MSNYGTITLWCPRCGWQAKAHTEIDPDLVALNADTQGCVAAFIHSEAQAGIEGLFQGMEQHMKNVHGGWKAARQ